MNYDELAIEKHKEWRGKIEIKTRAPLNDKNDLSIAYTPGVAAACLAIKDNIDLSFDYTRRWNTVAVVTDGTAVLGLGDIGPEAGMPVMEGKAALFKEFGDVDAIPLCIRSKNVDDIVNTVTLLQGSFGGINLEDISAPRCFEIEKRLKESCDIPIFHDDQHGTAIVTLAGLINALKIVNKKPEETKTVISGAGAAAVAIAKLMLTFGFKDITLCRRSGAVSKDVKQENESLDEISKLTNPNNLKGSLAEVIKGADILLGVSGPSVVSEEMVKTMNKDAIVFAMANPVPEIMPELAKKAGARIIATGRSDFPNQINNVLAFPGIFRGAFDARAKDINLEMMIAAAKALASLVDEKDLNEDFIITSPFNRDAAKIVASAVKLAWENSIK